MLHHIAAHCGCCFARIAPTVKGMNLHQHTPTAQALQFTLEPGQPVMPLHLRAGQSASLEVLEGRLWLTQHGEQSDVFLDAGKTLALHGPALLYAGADGTQPLRVRWVQEARLPVAQEARLRAA